MHPAYSVIFFTVSSGIGFGLIMLAGVFAGLGRLPADQPLALMVMSFALAMAVAGLMSSALHLGHPERAWRAFSQWRTSWLSREGVAAVLTFPPALFFAFGWGVMGDLSSPYACAGGIAAVLALITVLCTGMIYQSLAAIRAWANPLVTPGYIIMALATGSLWLAAAMRMTGHYDPAIAHLPFATVLAAWIIKGLYWWRIDHHKGGPTAQSATGLGGEGTSVKLLEAPHTQENFVMREMGYHVARRHAVRLRRFAQAFGFALPLVLTESLLVLPGNGGIALTATLIAALSGTIGISVERWLFFAEARHAVTLYYGAQRV